VVSRWQTRALIVGAIAAALSLIGLFVAQAQFFHSYLFAWLFWAGLPFGALVVVMMQNLTGGQWGQAVRGLSTAAFRTLPMMALLFIPIVLGIHDIYGWANGHNGESPGYYHKAQYLNVGFFTARAIFYFVVVITIAILLKRWMGRDGPPGRPSDAVTHEGSEPHPRRAQRSRPTMRVSALSAIGLIVYVLCMNFARCQRMPSVFAVISFHCAITFFMTASGGKLTSRCT
jgi:hypothetical protein